MLYPRRVLNSLAGRLALLQLLIYALLLPGLFWGLDALARSSGISSFTLNVRGYATSLARELELSDILDSPGRSVVFLDGSVEGAGCLYAAVEYQGRLTGSSASETPAWVQQRGGDRDFDSTRDNIYAVAVPFKREDSAGTLYLGFDKKPTLQRLGEGRRRILDALAIYGIASLLAAVLLARLVSRPLTQLQTASRRIAQGDSATRLGTDSSIVEIAGLADDLEDMRRELVGTAQRLRGEMEQRRIEQAERLRLENQLRNEQRLATVGTLAGGVAHEFNNILVPLTLYTEEAADEISADHAARPHLDRVLKAANRANQVVAKLLAFSRPTPERPPEAVDLAQVTHEALDLAQALKPANVELIRDITPHSEFVLGDATLLNQVVLNLCSNAFQAMHESGGTLSVRVHSRPRHNGDSLSGGSPRILELRVKDSGEGISPEVQERMFEPFFTTREVGQGSGLGLSIVHGIVSSMGGGISVLTRPGEGSEFIVELPVFATGGSKASS